MEHGIPQMYLVSSGIEVSDPDQGGYYSLGSVGVWVEVRVRAGHSSAGAVGVRWTIDGWESQHDTLGVCRQPDAEGGRWRIEIPHLVTIGWRDGSIGGPDGEQPSNKVWTLWGPDRGGVRCLPWGSPVPAFEFALFVKTGDTTHWNNNGGQNFRIDLSPYGRKPDTQEKGEGP